MEIATLIRAIIKESGIENAQTREELVIRSTVLQQLLQTKYNFVLKDSRCTISLPNEILRAQPDETHWKFPPHKYLVNKPRGESNHKNNVDVHVSIISRRFTLRAGTTTEELTPALVS